MPNKIGDMTVNQNLPDVNFEQTDSYLVGREKLREFASSVLAFAPIHHKVDAARAAGFDDLVAPPTFPIVIQEKTLQQLLRHPDAGIDFSRVVHGDQKFEYIRPLIAGDEVVAKLKVIGIQEVGGHTLLTSETKITSVSGDLLVTATSTLVIRGRKNEDG